MKELLSPLLAIVGVIVGASVQFLFSRITESRKSYDKLRTDSYVDFIKGCAGVAMAQRFEDQDEHAKASTLMLDAKVRIAIYGDSDISKSVGAFFGKYGDFTKQEDRRAFVDLMCQMRRSVTGSISDADRVAIGLILFSDVVGERLGYFFCPAELTPAAGTLVDLDGFEPSTSSMPWKRAPNCATGPQGDTARGLLLR
jgi:hypothetical protein